jgi:hypothetical protein
MFNNASDDVIQASLQGLGFKITQHLPPNASFVCLVFDEAMDNEAARFIGNTNPSRLIHELKKLFQAMQPHAQVRELPKQNPLIIH